MDSNEILYGKTERFCPIVERLPNLVDWSLLPSTKRILVNYNALDGWNVQDTSQIFSEDLAAAYQLDDCFYRFKELPGSSGSQCHFLIGASEPVDDRVLMAMPNLELTRLRDDHTCLIGHKGRTYTWRQALAVVADQQNLLLD